MTLLAFSKVKRHLLSTSSSRQHPPNKTSGSLASSVAGFWFRLSKIRERESALEDQIVIALARYYETYEQTSEAIEVLERAIKSHPDNSALHIKAGKCYESMGILAAAISAYGRAVDADPGNHLPYKLLGLLLLTKTEDTVRGKKLLVRSFQLDPDQPDIENLLPLY